MIYEPLVKFRVDTCNATDVIQEKPRGIRPPCSRGLTRVPLGGGDSAPPKPDFLDSSKAAVNIDTKLSGPSSASIWRLHQNFRKIR